MRYSFYIFAILLTFTYSQNRSLIFSTGAPDGTEGHEINWDGNSGYSLSNRIYINNNMVLEAMKFYATTDPFAESTLGRIILQSDNNNAPGDTMYSWTVDIAQENHGSNYFVIITTDQCLYLDEGNYYWITLHSIDESDITWLYSNNSTFTYSTSNDLGATWNQATVDQCGALSVYAEYIYELEINEVVGDINNDGSSNVLDVVILANIVIADETVDNGDLTNDGQINVLDIVALVNLVLADAQNEQLQSWDYIDINPNSLYFDQLIGPTNFINNVSLYYFGKAG